MIAVTFALSTESSALLTRLSERTKIERNGIRLIRGRIENKDVEILHTGVGTSICRRRMEFFLRAQNFGFLISCGFAGAVSERFRPGDLLLADNFSQSQLLSAAQEVLRVAPIHTAKLFTANRVIDSAEERIAIAEKTEAAAVDMETSAIAEACSARGIALLSLRVITDTLSEPLPAPPDILFDIERQKTPFLRLGAHAVIHPEVIGRLLGFRRHIASARQTLADALINLVTKL